MAPMYGFANYEFSSEEEWHDESSEESSEEDLHKPGSLTEMAFWYMIILISMLLLWLLIFFCLRIIALRQKTRSQQPRPMYAGTRVPIPRRDSLGPPATVYVSPSNLPPPPKYDFAPPSYDEVVGVHYPQYSAQPISQPITAALASQSNQSQHPAHPVTDCTSVTVINEPQRTSVTVART